MPEKRQRYVAVIGPAEADAASMEQARAIGQGLASGGAIVICGGLGGIMEAVAHGVAEAGGICVGLLPGGDRSAGNPYLTVSVPTGLGELRNGLVINSAHAVIAVDGSWGTMSEVSLAMRVRVPVIGLHTWSVQDFAGSMIEGLIIADSAEHAVELALSIGSQQENQPSP